MDISATVLKGRPEKISPYVARTPIALSERMGGSFERQHGVLHSAYNEDMMYQGEDDVRYECSVDVLNNSGPSTYMMNTLLKRVEYLEERIVSLETLMESQIHPKKVRSIASACQDLSVFCGRICCDTEGGRLNPQSLVLEGSIACSRGARVKLDIQSCEGYRLFPGQIVAVIGKNPTGFCIVAQEVVHSFPFSDGDTEDEETHPFSMVVASGPYTPTDSLMYEPLKAIIEYCEKEKPDVLMLLGPFVDQDHPSISKGTVDVTFEDIFELQVMEEIRMLKNHTKVLIMPSVKDVHHDVAFPQQPLDVSEDANTESLPNPATIRYAGTVLSCSSIDWLMSSTKEEISKSVSPVDRLSTLAAHIVQQKSYYPMYPPSGNIALDVSTPDALDIAAVPEILVTPSDLAPFAKCTKLTSPSINMDNESSPVSQGSSRDIICINPGRITKGATAGTFAHVYINKKGTTEERITSRCKVEIKKL